MPSCDGAHGIAKDAGLCTFLAAFRTLSLESSCAGGTLKMPITSTCSITFVFFSYSQGCIAALLRFLRHGPQLEPYRIWPGRLLGHGWWAFQQFSVEAEVLSSRGYLQNHTTMGEVQVASARTGCDGEGHSPQKGSLSGVLWSKQGGQSLSGGFFHVLSES